MLAPVLTRALIVSFPMPDVAPAKTATRGAVASLMSALAAFILSYETIKIEAELFCFTWELNMLIDGENIHRSNGQFDLIWQLPGPINPHQLIRKISADKDTNHNSAEDTTAIEYPHGVFLKETI